MVVPVFSLNRFCDRQNGIHARYRGTKGLTLAVQKSADVRIARWPTRVWNVWIINDDDSVVEKSADWGAPQQITSRSCEHA